MPAVCLHYRLLASALPSEGKRIRTSYIPTLILVVAAATVVFVALGLSKGATPRLMIIYGLMMVAYIGCLLVWYPRRMMRRLNRCWETYDLEIGPDYLLRRQADIPDLRLQFAEVRSVEHVRGRYLRVIGKSKGHAIAIPEGLEQFDEVAKAISSICPVRERTIEQWQKNRAFMAVALLLFVIMLWATSRAVVVPLSLATGSMIAWVFFWIRRNPDIPEKTKRTAWIYWLFFAICFLKLFVAVGEIDKGSATFGKVAANLLVFSPCLLLVFGWMRWSLAHRGFWRNYAIAWGLAAASVSALLLYGVISYVQLAHIGSSSEHRLAMAGVYLGFPLAVAAVIGATVGQGRSRVIAWIAGASLALVWGFAFFFA